MGNTWMHAMIYNCRITTCQSKFDPFGQACGCRDLPEIKMKPGFYPFIGQPLPVLVEKLAELNEHIDVFALCLDPEEDRWKKFVEEHNMHAIHNVIDPDLESRYYMKYHVDITPELYVLDENNKIVGKNLHPDQLTKFIQKRLK